MKAKLIALAAAALAVASIGTAQAAEPKHGGILKFYHRETPPSLSILEEATFSVNAPAMAMFNNLVEYDQHKPQNSMETIVPDLATSWSWDKANTALTFKLRQGVTWHDGKPFTSKDVKCTFDLLLDKNPNDKLRKNPRKGWFENITDVTTNGDFEATLHLKRPQPSILAMVASGYTPMYPCHVPSAQQRTHPIGTGPFMFADEKQNESIKLVKNPHYWKKGLPYLDGIEYTIIKNRATAVLAFVAGKVDVTFPTEMTKALEDDIKKQDPTAICEIAPINVNTNLIVNRDKPPFDNVELRKAMAMSLDRKAFIDLILQGQGDAGGSLLPPPEGVWGMPPEILKTIPGYGDVAKDRETARAIMKKLGYGPDKPLKIKVSTRNLATYRDPAVVLIDQLKSIWIDAELEPVEFELLVRQGGARRLCGRPQPHRQRHRRSGPVVLRELRLRLAAQLHALLQQGPAEAVRPAVAGNRPRQAQETGVGDRQEDPGGRGAADPVPRPDRHLLEALRQEHDRDDQQRLQRLSLRGRVARQISG